MPWNDRIKRRIKLRDLDILMAVIEAGSMGKAASRLNISQPAISKAIVELEDALGVQLFDRGPARRRGDTLRACVAHPQRFDFQ
jgi:DNA-binding transcriptional LysR family regulator